MASSLDALGEHGEEGVEGAEAGEVHDVVQPVGGEEEAPLDEAARGQQGSEEVGHLTLGLR